MPIFEFRCQQCGHLFEKLFISSDQKVELKCPECQGESLERVISRTNHVMGGGKPGASKPSVTTKSCGSGNECLTLEIPGHGD